MYTYMALNEKTPPRKVGFNVVESAANTFTALKIDLPNTKGINAYDLDKVEARLVPYIPAAADDLGEYELQIVKGGSTAPTALLGADDDRLLYTAKVYTSSGTEAADFSSVFIREVGVDHIGYAELIANDFVYILVQGTALAGAVTIKGKLIGSLVKMTPTDLSTLLLNELQ